MFPNELKEIYSFTIHRFFNLRAQWGKISKRCFHRMRILALPTPYATVSFVIFYTLTWNVFYNYQLQPRFQWVPFRRSVNEFSPSFLFISSYEIFLPIILFISEFRSKRILNCRSKFIRQIEQIFSICVENTPGNRNISRMRDN